MKKLFFLCVLVTGLVACKKSKMAGNQGSVEVFPNKVGDRWTYQVNDTTYTSQNPDNISQYILNVSIIDSTTMPGGVRANTWVFDSPAGEDTNYVFQVADTLNFASWNGATMNIERRYVLPIQQNSSWLYTPVSISDVMIDISSNVIVNQQVFTNAFHLIGNPRSPDGIYSLEEWIAGNIGIISRYINTSTTLVPVKHHTSWSIVSFQLN